MNKSVRKTLIAAAVLAALAAPVAYMLVASPLPAQTPPPGLLAGHARVQFFSGLLTRPSDALAAMPVAALPLDVPRAASLRAASGGFANLATWFRAPVTGQYRIVVAADAVYVNAPCHWWSRSSGCEVPATAAGKIALAAGWHEIHISTEVRAPGSPASRAPAAISIRAPGAGTALPLVPYWPVPATAAPTAK